MPGAGVVHHIIRVTLTVRLSLPAFPNKRTIQEPVGMSQRWKPSAVVKVD